MEVYLRLMFLKFRAARELLGAGPLPTAIVAGNDECALGLIESFLREGVDVPRDVSVVGHDDSRIARLSFLNLTTVRQDAALMAEAAVQAASRRLEDETAAARHILLPPTLVVRQTTGPARSEDVMTA
jgi:DNA-binding LacI/PurR family transcriptional regulator